MIDAFHLPYGFKGDLKVFNAPQTVSSGNLQWQTWQKPRGCTMAHIICMGAGAGGGGGFTRAAAAAGGGGGGGGSGGITRITAPLILLPDILYVQAGLGGRGVASGGGQAGNGLISTVSVFPNTDTTNILAISGSVVATGGNTGTGAAVGAAGAGSTINSSQTLANIGQWATIAGQAGAAGGAVAGAIGTAVAIPITGLVCMGAPGGAGTTSADFAGGIITGLTAGTSLISDSRPQGAAAGSFDGSGGWLIPKPFFSYCGLGGSSSNAGIGGNGGPGGPGSGGGGGGAGTTGGRGGDGGPGIVWILSW